jgi:hypothetical protein
MEACRKFAGLGYGPPRVRILGVVLRRDPANYRCSLGTNTVLGLVTNGLLAVSRDCGAETEASGRRVARKWFLRIGRRHFVGNFIRVGQAVTD